MDHTRSMLICRPCMVRFAFAAPESGEAKRRSDPGNIEGLASPADNATSKL